MFMNYFRCFFALPDPNIDWSKKTSLEILREKYRRRGVSPLFRFLTAYKRRRKLLLQYFANARDYLWRASFGRWLWVKQCSFAKTEVATMRFISAHTSIPVPRVWLQFRWRSFDYIIMDRIPGVTLSCILRDLPSDTEEVIAAQLAQYLAELRALPPPPGSTAICSVIGGPVNCFRLYDDTNTPICGPFRDEEQLNHHIRHFHALEEFSPTVISAHQKSHRLVFTHNDLAPRNIMVDPESSRILALLDWECAGWFPTHWEYCKVMNYELMNHPNEKWKRMVLGFVPGRGIFEEEADADCEILKQLWVPTGNLRCRGY